MNIIDQSEAPCILNIMKIVEAVSENMIIIESRIIPVKVLFLTTQHYSFLLDELVNLLRKVHISFHIHFTRVEYVCNAFLIIYQQYVL